MFESFGGADEHPTIKYNFAGGTGDRSPPSTKHYLAEGEKNDMQKVRESFERKIVPLNAANNGGIAMTSGLSSAEEPNSGHPSKLTGLSPSALRSEDAA